jgi:hypothetical protein
MNGSVQILVNVGSHAKNLPSRQTAVSGAVCAGTALDLSLQDVGCCDQRRLGRLPITFELSRCSFKQLGQAVRNEVKLLVDRSRRISLGNLKSFHIQSLRRTIRMTSDWRESAAKGVLWLVNQRYGMLISNSP